MPRVFPLALALALVPSLLPSLARAQAATPAAAELPLKHDPRPTTAAITAADLMTRLYIFADDSMQGRESGTIGNVKGTNYIAGELARLGLVPAGDSGTFFQTIPMLRRTIAPNAGLRVGSVALVVGTDIAPVPPLSIFPFGASRTFDGVQTIYGGRLGEATLTPEQVAGKLVVFDAPSGPSGQPTFQFWSQQKALADVHGAAGVAVATLSLTPPQIVGYFSEPQMLLADGTKEGPVGMIVTTAAARTLMGASLEGMKPGTLGRTPVAGLMGFADQPSEAPARNVVAILPGSDPALRGQYVAIGAHNDHDGLMARAVDHDSLRILNRFVRPGGAESPARAPSADEERRIRSAMDSVRALRAPRADSVMNGADDDGSGSMGVLEIAEMLSRRAVKPKRSILFVWHTAEEKGLFGSEWFTDHPTVPRDSIVAQLNIDMIGRGGPQDDVENGGPRYVQLIGSRRLSRQLGDLVEQVNTDRKYGFKFDYSFDANGHPQQYYCRSDHYNYARYGIPIVFFSTGGHEDYHEPTDEPQYIDYDHYARVTNLVSDIALTLADAPTRPVVDGKKPDPHGECKQ